MNVKVKEMSVVIKVAQVLTPGLTHCPVPPVITPGGVPAGALAEISRLVPLAKVKVRLRPPTGLHTLCTDGRPGPGLADDLVLPQLKLEFPTRAECNPPGRRNSWGQDEQGDIGSTARRTRWRS